MLRVDVVDVGQAATLSSPRSGRRFQQRLSWRFVAPLLLAIGAAGGQTTPPAPPRRFVFIGGTGAGFARLADPTAARQMLETGVIGPYRHGNGMAALSAAQRAALSAIWSPTGASVGEVGGFVPVDPAYLGYFGGAYPREVNMNIITGVGDGSGVYAAGVGDAHPGQVYAGHFTADDLATTERAIDAAIGVGARNVAVVLTPNGGGEDLDDPFTTGAYWTHVRQAALYGGGIGIDAPPTYFYARGPAYQAMVIQMLRFARRQGLRSSFIVSPFPSLAPDQTPGNASCGLEPAFLTNTMRLVADLQAAQAMPSQWVVENYTATAGCNGSDIEAEGGPGSLNEVALYLAGIPPAPAGSTPPRAPGGVSDLLLK